MGIFRFREKYDRRNQCASGDSCSYGTFRNVLMKQSENAYLWAVLKSLIFYV